MEQEATQGLHQIALGLQVNAFLQQRARLQRLFIGFSEFLIVKLHKHQLSI